MTRRLSLLVFLWARLPFLDCQGAACGRRTPCFRLCPCVSYLWTRLFSAGVTRQGLVRQREAMRFPHFRSVNAKRGAPFMGGPLGVFQMGAHKTPSISGCAQRIAHNEANQQNSWMTHSCAEAAGAGRSKKSWKQGSCISTAYQSANQKYHIGVTLIS